MQKRTMLLVFGLLIAGVAAAFLLLDFRALQGQFDSERQVTTFGSNLEAGQPLAPDRDLDLYVVGPGQFAGRLSEALAGRLGASAYIGMIRRQQPPLERAGGSLLWVEVVEPRLLWTPFYSRASLQIRLAYASDGEADWIDEEVVRFEGGEPTRRLRGEYQVRDRAFGLLSLPGYYSYLSEQAAALIDESLQAALSAP